MLVLSRKAGQQIQIGDGVFVTVLGIQGNTVRIGFDAPREVLIMRLELPKVAPATTTDAAMLIMGSLPRPPIVDKAG